MVITKLRVYIIALQIELEDFKGLIHPFTNTKLVLEMETIVKPSTD